MKLYMAVTYDKLELPICVADSIVELSDKLGIKANNIRSLLSRSRKGYEAGRNTGIKFVEVVLWTILREYNLITLLE